jgi:multidrug transporter EmrE-like cation transporter
MKWILLAGAIISEVAASLSLKAVLNDPASSSSSLPVTSPPSPSWQ